MKRAIALSVTLLIAGCGMFDGSGGSSKESKPMAAPGAQTAVAEIHPTKGDKPTGVVHFTQMGDKVKIVADIEGLEPNTTHGFHIHEHGDCGDEGKAAGGHYNPEGHPHAAPDKSPRHAGDLGNITADAKGKAHLELTVDNITINGQKNPIAGRSVIVHADPDDFSQPTGNAGGRIGCGVIKSSNR